MARVYGQSVDDCSNRGATERNSFIALPAQNTQSSVWSGNYQKPWDYRKTHQELSSLTHEINCLLLFQPWSFSHPGNG